MAKKNCYYWCGFLGSHVADYFSNQKYQVIIADKKTQELRKNQTFYKLDLNKKINYEFF